MFSGIGLTVQMMGTVLQLIIARLKTILNTRELIFATGELSPRADIVTIINSSTSLCYFSSIPNRAQETDSIKST
jgi:hypothetical protein